jgi:hypothetical protein
MSRTNEHDGYAGIADFYDEVAPYRERPDIDFYVEAAAAPSRGRTRRACVWGDSSPGRPRLLRPGRRSTSSTGQGG